MDATKFTALLRAKQAAVGKLASIWMKACQALGVNVPSWVARHSGELGYYEDQSSQADLPYLEFGGTLPDTLSPAVAEAMQTRLAYAVEYQKNAMQRALRHYTAKTGQDAGFQTSGIPAAPLEEAA